MKRKLSSLIIAVLAISSLANATTRKVLYIGNSYTFTNNMPAMVDSIARAMGDTIIFDVSAPGGYTFQQHCTNATTLAKIVAQQWDVVILQEQSQMPAFPPSQVATDVYPYARRLDSLIHANDSCTQTMFMMTWGHANGDPANCAGYPVICTYSGMQMRLRESYLQMATDNRGDIIPVGNAFRIMMDSAYSPWIFSPDSSHPSVAGSYLEACTIYSSIFHRPTKNCSYLAGLTATDASLLKRISGKVVFDSLALWQGTGHYPYAGFTFVVASSLVPFTNHSPVSANHYWSFGDGGHDTAANPSHFYGMGAYTVSHTVATNFFSETLIDTVYGPESVAHVSRYDNIIRIVNGEGGSIRFQLLQPGYDALEVCDSRGVIVRKYNISDQIFTDVFAPGFYFFRLRGRDGATICGKMAAW